MIVIEDNPDNLRTPAAMFEAEAAAERARIRAARQAFEREAQALAEKFGCDLAALSYQLNRYSFGSLSHSWDAAQQRRLFARALQLAPLLAQRGARDEADDAAFAVAAE